MSAFVVSPNHIAGIIRYAARNSEGQQDLQAIGCRSLDIPYGSLTLEGAARQCAKLLMEANVYSVNVRYPQDTAVAEPVKVDLAPKAPSMVEAAKMIDCLAYQSCEFEGWEASLAYQLLARLRENMLRALIDADLKLKGEYEDAKWSVA